MTEDFWKYVIGALASSVIPSVLAWQAKSMGKRNNRDIRANSSNLQQGLKDQSKELKEIHHKVNGGFEERLQEAKRQSAPQVLVVDDDPYDVQQMSRILRSFGADIIACVSADEVADILHSRVGSGRGLPFDIALIDLKLPGTDALEILKVFDDIAPWVPTAVITGALRPDLVEKVTKSRPTMVLSKPLDEAMTEKLFRLYHIPFSRKG